MPERVWLLQSWDSEETSGSNLIGIFDTREKAMAEKKRYEDMTSHASYIHYQVKAWVVQ